MTSLGGKGLTGVPLYVEVDSQIPGGEVDDVNKLFLHSQSVVRCLWHPKLNQIMVGCADGKAKVLFSPKHSIR